MLDRKPVFETFVGTAAGVLHIGTGAEPLGLSDQRISAIHAFHDRKGDVVILAGSYGNGLFRTADGGRTWAAVTDGLTAPAARTIGPDPLDPGALLCGTEPARLYRSGDEGLTWSELDGIRALPAHEEWYLPYSIIARGRPAGANALKVDNAATARCGWPKGFARPNMRDWSNDRPA